MAESWLTNKSRFCVAPNGDYQGNDDTCYWGLPSIEASDPAFPALGYWRGYVSLFPPVGHIKVPQIRSLTQLVARQVRVGTDGAAHILGPSELRPRAHRPDRPEGAVRADGGNDARPVAAARAFVFFLSLL